MVQKRLDASHRSRPGKNPARNINFPEDWVKTFDGIDLSNEDLCSPKIKSPTHTVRKALQLPYNSNQPPCSGRVDPLQYFRPFDQLRPGLVQVCFNFIKSPDAISDL